MRAAARLDLNGRAIRRHLCLGDKKHAPTSTGACRGRKARGFSSTRATTSTRRSHQFRSLGLRLPKAGAFAYDGLSHRFMGCRKEHKSLRICGRCRLKMWSAMLVCCLQRRYRIGLRNKFMGYITGIVRLSNRIQDRRIIEFLGLIQIVPSRVAGGVIKPDQVVTSANGADDVTLHNLHVIDIIQKFYAR
jgi:hypothetical protein